MKKIFLVFLSCILQGFFLDSLLASDTLQNVQRKTLEQLQATYTLPDKTTIRNIKDIEEINRLRDHLIQLDNKLEVLLNLDKNNNTSKEIRAEHYQIHIYKDKLLCISVLLVQQEMKLLGINDHSK